MDVPNYNVPPSAPQPVTPSQVLHTMDGRFVNASTQVGDSLWNVHTIGFTSSAGTFARPRFYQIDTEGTGINTVKQQGFFSESVSSHDFNASISANGTGEAFVTWTSTDVSTALSHNARVRISGRQPTDPLGVIPAGTSLFTSPVALTGQFSTRFNAQRWGDYSAVSLDPSSIGLCGANRRAWIINETIVNANTWGSRIARIGFCE